jgi:hypothetical protein
MDYYRLARLVRDWKANSHQTYVCLAERICRGSAEEPKSIRPLLGMLAKIIEEPKKLNSFCSRMSDERRSWLAARIEVECRNVSTVTPIDLDISIEMPDDQQQLVRHASDLHNLEQSVRAEVAVAVGVGALVSEALNGPESRRASMACNALGTFTALVPRLTARSISDFLIDVDRQATRVRHLHECVGLSLPSAVKADPDTSSMADSYAGFSLAILGITSADTKLAIKGLHLQLRALQRPFDPSTKIWHNIVHTLDLLIAQQPDLVHGWGMEVLPYAKCSAEAVRVALREVDAPLANKWFAGHGIES